MNINDPCIQLCQLYSDSYHDACRGIKQKSNCEHYDKFLSKLSFMNKPFEHLKSTLEIKKYGNFKN